MRRFAESGKSKGKGITRFGFYSTHSKKNAFKSSADGERKKNERGRKGIWFRSTENEDVS